MLGISLWQSGLSDRFQFRAGNMKALLHGLDDFVLDALRYTPHPMHSNVEQSLALLNELKPERAWFTHICHDLGHEAANAKLPRGVQLAYDGLKFEVEI